MRDYIHVVDLADGHLKAMQAKSNCSGTHIYNLGTGKGYSVLEMIQAFEKASGLTVPYQIKARRSGDIAVCFADLVLNRNRMESRTRFSNHDGRYLALAATKP